MTNTRKRGGSFSQEKASVLADSSFSCVASFEASSSAVRFVARIEHFSESDRIFRFVWEIIR